MDDSKKLLFTLWVATFRLDAIKQHVLVHLVVYLHYKGQKISIVGTLTLDVQLINIIIILLFTNGFLKLLCVLCINACILASTEILGYNHFE